MAATIALDIAAGVRERLDRYVAHSVPDLSRSRLQKLIETGNVQINERICQDKKTIVQAGDRVVVNVPDDVPLDLAPADIPLDILYEDGWLIVLNKPPGLVVHPAPGHADGTLVNALLFHCSGEDGTVLSSINGTARPGIVHRLDKDTSGVMVVAKTDAAHQHLQQQIQAKTARREYLGIVVGSPQADSGTIDAPIGRHLRDRKRMAVVDGGRTAVTHWRVLERLGNATLLHFTLETGRTHQIRVHAAHAGWAIAGDPVYGHPLRAMPRQALHAWRLTLTHPRSGTSLTIEAPPPADFLRYLNALRHRYRS